MDIGLHEVYVDVLRDLYDVELQLVKALPKLVDTASNIVLREAIDKNHEQTKYHIVRLEQIFERLGEKPAGEGCFAIKGLIQDANDITSKGYARGAKDAALVVAIQRIEHYQIAGYGAVRSFARHLEDDESANQLQQTLNEEVQTDRMLSELAECEINFSAAQTWASVY